MQSALKPKPKPAGEAHISEVNVVDLLAGSHVMFGTDEKEVFEVNTIEHECMVTSRLSEVLEALSASPKTSLSEDKLYHAALDSACNRSCAGSLWINHTKDALRCAPKYIRRLIKIEPEQERFRFGNGGTLVSHERVRLPFLLGGKVVLVWISNVPCHSLGCLLGKDVLDGLGAVHDFLANRVKFQLLSQDRWVRLSRLDAGHSSICFLPTPLSQWPKLSTMSWIGVGKAKVCEVQVESKVQWLLRKLKRVSMEEAAENEACMVGHSPSSSNSSDRRADHCLGDAHLCPIRTSRTASSAMEADVSSHGSEESMALEGDSLMDSPEAFPEGPASSTPCNVFGRRLDPARQGHGGTRIMAEEMVPGGQAQVQPGTSGLHRGRGLHSWTARLHQQECPEEDSAGHGGRDEEASTTIRGEAAIAATSTTWSPRVFRG